MQRSRTSPEKLTFSSDHRLSSGLYSNHGEDGSFRGKVYVEVFQTITGLSLYETLCPEQVKEAARLLAAWDGPPPSSYRKVTVEELADLTKLFCEAAAQDCACVPWY